MGFLVRGVGVALLGFAFTACAGQPSVPVHSGSSISDARVKAQMQPLPKNDGEPTADPDDGPGLDPSQVASVVTSKYGAVGGCHTIEYSGTERQSGSVMLDWVINPDGSVRRVDVVETSFLSSQFHECVLSVAQGLQFPSAVGKTEVSWQFRFRERTERAGQVTTSLR